MGLILGWGMFPEEGNGSPLQCSYLETHGQRSLVGHSPQGHRESDTTWWLNSGYGGPLLGRWAVAWTGRAWQPTPVFLPGNPWTEEPGGPQSTGSQRVGHDLVTKQWLWWSALRSVSCSLDGEGHGSHSSVPTWKTHGQRSLAGHSPRQWLNNNRSKISLRG